MRIGIVSEGHSDRAVITSIILKASNLTVSDIKAIRPIYKLDATDLANGSDRTFSNWTHVKRECEEKEMIGAFLSIEGQDFVIIHIDTAEAELYDVQRPDRASNSYCIDLRHTVISKIQEWLAGEFLDQILYAVAIEEIEAWLLSINTDMKDTTKSAKAKEKLHFELGKRGIDSTIDEANFIELSKPLVKAKSRELKDILDSNCSLREFYEEVVSKLVVKVI